MQCRKSQRNQHRFPGPRHLFLFSRQESMMMIPVLLRMSLSPCRPFSQRSSHASASSLILDSRSGKHLRSGSRFRKGDGEGWWRRKEQTTRETSGPAMHLDAQTSLAPVPPLSVVAVLCMLAICALSHRRTRQRPPPHLVQVRHRSSARGRRVLHRTGWCCPFGDESIEGWGGSASSPWRASAWCGKTCGSVVVKNSIVSFLSSHRPAAAHSRLVFPAPSSSDPRIHPKTKFGIVFIGGSGTYRHFD